MKRGIRIEYDNWNGISTMHNLRGIQSPKCGDVVCAVFSKGRAEVLWILSSFFIYLNHADDISQGIRDIGQMAVDLEK